MISGWASVPTCVVVMVAEASFGTVAYRPFATAAAGDQDRPDDDDPADVRRRQLTPQAQAKSAPQRPAPMATGTVMARPSSQMSCGHGNGKTWSFHSFSMTMPTVPISSPPIAPNDKRLVPQLATARAAR